MRYEVVTDFPKFHEVIKQLQTLSGKGVDQKLIDSMDWTKPLDRIPRIFDNSKASLDGGLNSESNPRTNYSEKDMLLTSCENYINGGGYKWKNDVDSSSKGYTNLTDSQIHNKFVQEADMCEEDFVRSGSSFIEDILSNNRRSQTSSGIKLLFG